MDRPVVVVNSNVKGYHFFKIKPHKNIKMLVQKEYGNVKDESSMKIVCHH